MQNNNNTIEEFQVDSLHIYQAPTRLEMGELAATMATDAICSVIEEKGSCRMIFASAPSQNEFLAALAAAPEIDWSKITAFHMDEYIGLPSDAPQNFGVFLEERLFNKVNIGKFHRLDGNNPDIQQEIQRYQGLLQEAPIDVICMGIGENCHIAFNDPHVAEFNDAAVVKVVGLDQVSREQQVNDGCFATIDLVPTDALTLTIPTLVSPQALFCIVPGKNKAEAIKHTLHDTITETYPSTILRKHNNAHLFIDADSASLI